MLNASTEGFWLTDTQGRFLEVNTNYCQMSGYSSEELLTMNVLDVEAVVSASSFAFHMQKVIAQGQGRFETQHRHKDGSLFEVSISAQYQKTEGGRFVVFLEDITKNEVTIDQIQSLQLKQAAS
jgi:PAS domain S-box-containing protein